MGRTRQALGPAARLLFESGAADAAMLAELTGYKQKTVERLAAREGWNGNGQDIDADVLQARLSRQLLYWIDQIEKLAQPGKAEPAPFDRSAVDTISTHIRTIERVSDLVRQHMPQEKKNKNAETAAVLERIHNAIVELAFEHAREIAARGNAGADAEGGRE